MSSEALGYEISLHHFVEIRSWKWAQNDEYGVS